MSHKITCPTCLKVHTELRNAKNYMDNAPNAEIKRENIEHVIDALLQIIKESTSSSLLDLLRERKTKMRQETDVLKDRKDYKNAEGWEYRLNELQFVIDFIEYRERK